jgi:PAS domain S-box-containing protein
MTEEKADKNQSIAKRLLEKRKLLSPFVVQLVFMVVGLALTVLSFAVLNIFIKNMVKEEYERVARSTVESLVDNFSALEPTMETVSAILFLSQDADRRVMSEKVRDFVPAISNFDQIVWVYKTPEGKWRFSNVFLRAEQNAAQRRYTVNPGRELLDYIINTKLLSDPRTRVVTDLPFVVHTPSGATSQIEVAPFAFVKTLEQDNPEAGVLIGVSTASNVLDEDWLRQHEEVSRITIRHPDSGYSFYNLERKTDAGEKFSNDMLNAYEFRVADKQWELRTEFMKEQKVTFLEVMPLYALLFGFILTSFGTLYLRSHLQQSVEVTTMYKAIEQKNTELKHEVEERAKLNQALRKAEKENRSIIDAVSDIIFETDTEGQILFLSATWRKVTGFTPEQSKGLELFKMLHPEDQERQRDNFRLMVAGQKQAYRTFTRLRTSDGTFRAVELALSMIRQDENKNLRVVGTFTDVEERRRAERALSEAEKKYRTIVENAAGGIFQLTPEGLYLSANPALSRILGYRNPEDMLREVKNANETIYVNARERQTFLRDLESRGNMINYETQIYSKDGQKIWVNENVRAVRDENNNTLYYEGSLEDITSRKEADMALRNAKVHSDLANRAKSEFLANMSHELRTPLNSIIGFSEIIRNEVFGAIEPRSYADYAKDIHESGKRLLTVINEILDISKIEAGERYLNEAVVDLEKVVKSCLGLLGNKIQANQMTVTNLMKEVPTIVAEELAIKQVIMNLISNAVKFTPSGGRITISSEVDKDGQLRLSVTDTGIGLDESEIEKAFSPFGQVDNELNRGNSGTGLGLTLVDALIKLHGGQVEMFSQKGIGTTATIVLPADRVTVKKTKPAETTKA